MKLEEIRVRVPIHPSTNGHGSFVASKRRPLALWPLLILMGLLSLGGFVGGVAFLMDRSGAELGAKLSWLDRTPVDDFFLPGLFLLGVYGVGTLALMTGLIWRFSPGWLRSLDRRLGHHWSWAGTIAIGAVLIAWIVYEFTLFSDRMVLQPILLVVGAVMVAIPLLPSMRRYTSTRRKG
jgi:magnesium-transporting ATPase (P-type)